MNHFLYTLTNNATVIAEISDYCKNVFDCSMSNMNSFKATDEPFVEDWQNTVDTAKKHGADKAIQSHTILGNKNIILSKPDLTEIYIYQSFGGKIPIIYTKNVDDFEEMICKIMFKGIKHPNIKKMGSNFIHGKTSKFIILSNKPYSNVTADRLGLDAETWADYSMIIRREHESLHYFTKRFLGSARNHLHDELIADFVGIVSAVKEYKPEWFLEFLGFERDTINPNGRFKIYVDGLSEESIIVLKAICHKAAYNIERCLKDKTNNIIYCINFLCTHDLLELAEMS